MAASAAARFADVCKDCFFFFAKKKIKIYRILKTAYVFDNKHVTSISCLNVKSRYFFFYQGWLIYHARYMVCHKKINLC